MVDAGDSTAAGDTVWPNATSHTNSDRWLREHHDQVTVLKPRVLVLDVQRVGDPIETLVDNSIAAMAEGSRYHGYLDSNAPVFVQYQVDKILDLRDPTEEYPSFWPPAPFDAGALFTTEFAQHYGYKDAQDGHDLTLCEIFEQGLVNEIWIAAQSKTRNVFEHQSYVQQYDDNLEPTGQFSKCTNGCFSDPQNRVNCNVTVRMQEISKERGSGCFTHSQGHALENERGRIPYMLKNANRFFYFGMKQRYGLAYDDFYEMDRACASVSGTSGCLSFPQPNHLVFDPMAAQPSIDFTGFGQGCGNVHYSANVVWGSTLVADTACEGYGLGEGAGGADATTRFTTKRAHDLFGPFDDDCGGHWNLYMRQSMPGFGNMAHDTDGGPMKNWWTFWYY